MFDLSPIVNIETDWWSLTKSSCLMNKLPVATPPCSKCRQMNV